MHIDKIIDQLEASISTFALCEVRSDARFVLAEEDKTSIHYILAGNGVGWQVSGKDVDLTPHTIMIIPPRTSIAITCNRDGNWATPEPDCSPLSEGWIDIKVGSGEESVKLACAYLEARHMQTTGLFDYLHEPMILDIAADESMKEIYHRLLEEMAHPRPGTRAISELLMKQCLIEILRRQTDPDGEFTGPWLAAVTNQPLGRAITAMLDHPEKPHSLQTLADTAGMSRTAFAEQFKGLTGRTPIDFLRELRLRQAIRLLTATDLPIKTIAARVGFASRSYFSKAFKEFVGIDPINYRAHPVEFEPSLVATGGGGTGFLSFLGFGKRDS